MVLDDLRHLFINVVVICGVFFNFLFWEPELAQIDSGRAKLCFDKFNKVLKMVGQVLVFFDFAPEFIALVNKLCFFLLLLLPFSFSLLKRFIMLVLESRHLNLLLFGIIVDFCHALLIKKVLSEMLNRVIWLGSVSL